MGYKEDKGYQFLRIRISHDKVIKLKQLLAEKRTDITKFINDLIDKELEK